MYLNFQKNFIEEVALITTSLSFSPPKAGFPEGVANMWGSSKFDAGEGGFKSKYGAGGGGGEEHGESIK